MRASRPDGWLTGRAGEEHALGLAAGERHVSEELPADSVPDPERWAQQMVPVALERMYGPQNEGWRMERRPKKDDPSRTVAWVVIAPK